MRKIYSSTCAPFPFPFYTLHAFYSTNNSSVHEEPLCSVGFGFIVVSLLGLLVLVGRIGRLPTYKIKVRYNVTALCEI